MKKKQYSIDIQAPKNVVFNKLLGLQNKKDYETWTAAFNPTSTYEGSWDEGSKIKFIGTDEQGNIGGMVSEIAVNKPNEMVSIRHLGILQGDKELTDGPDVDPWKGALETYYLKDNKESTTVTVETDVADEYKDYFDSTWPKALHALKNLAEE